MNVKYHGPSGEYESTWPDDTTVDAEAYRDKVHYVYAGTQDGAHHYREVSA